MKAETTSMSLLNLSEPLTFRVESPRSKIVLYRLGLKESDLTYN